MPKILNTEARMIAGILPGQIGDLDDATYARLQKSAAWRAGWVRLATAEDKPVEPAPAFTGLASVPETGAIALVEREVDASRLRSWLSTEKRKRVTDAIKARLGAIE